MAELNRVFDILDHYKEQFPDQMVVAGKVDGRWKTYNVASFMKNVDDFSRAFVQHGIKKNDKIAIMSNNRPEWNFCDFGMMQLGAAAVPLYPTLSSQDLLHILTDAEIKMVFVSDKELYEKVSKALQQRDLTLPVYSFDKVDGAVHWLDFLAEEGATTAVDIA